MPWIEFKVGTGRLSHFIRTEAIVKVFSHEGEYGLATGICVQGQDMPTWVKKPVREVLSMIERAEKKPTLAPPEPEPQPLGAVPPSPENEQLDDDIPF